MDPMSSYFLDIRLTGNRKKMRKEFNCFRFDKVIDSDITNFKDFIKSIVDQYPPGYLEVPHVQYRDCVESIFPEVKTDQDLQLMFDKHKQTKVVEMFISYTDPIEPFVPITEWQSNCTPSPSQPKNTKPMQQQPKITKPMQQQRRKTVHLVLENQQGLFFHLDY
jgi:hypothetical protein